MSQLLLSPVGISPRDMSQEKGLGRNMESHQNESNRPDHNKFPGREVAILVLCVSVTAYTLVNLFPYVGIMVMQLMELKSINEAGFYAGYMASAFTFGRFLSGYAIGYMSDVVGRKPVLILGLSSITIFSLVFGFSESFSWAICSRFILGLTNGTMAASRTLIRELCGREHVVMGMVYIGGARAVALVLGTGIGGLLALPAVHYPTVFSSTGLFARYPFLLPNIFGAVFAGLTLHVVIFWLPESKRLTNNQGAGEFRRLAPDETAEEGNSRVTDGGTFGVDAAETTTLNGDAEETKIGFWGRGGIMRNRIVLAVLFLGCIVQTVVVGFDEAFPLWMLSTPDVGGLGWDSKQIGEVLLTTGLLMGVIQFRVLPSAMKAIGIVRWYRAGWVLLVLTLVLVPNSKNISWNSSSLFVVAIIGSLLVNCCLSAIMIAGSVASTNIVPVQHRGKLSGLYNTAESLGRFTGPVTYSTTYAMSIATSGPGSGLPWMDHHFVFYVTAIVLALLATIGWRTLTSEVLNRSSAG